MPATADNALLRFIAYRIYAKQIILYVPVNVQKILSRLMLQ